MQKSKKAGRALCLWGESTSELQEVAKQAEGSGFESVWSDELHRSAFVPLAAVACSTSQVQLGTGTALAFIRSPFTTALTALDLDELSGGRLILGLSSGVQRLNEDWHGVEFGKPITHFREAVKIIRQVMENASQGEPVSFEGEYYKIRLRGYHRPFPVVRDHIPIVLGGVGPRMVALAGEIADGWLGHELSSIDYIQKVIMPNLKEGLSRTGRQWDNFTICPSMVCAISKDASEARRIAAGAVAFHATVKTYRNLFAFHGFEEEVGRIWAAFRSGDYEVMINAVSDEMVDTYTAAGTLDQVRAKLATYDGMADSIKLMAPCRFVDPEVTRDQQQIIIESLAI
jgi:probable F420-dependent oxidoreductase